MGFGPGLLRRVLFDQAFVDASDENRRDSEWPATLFTCVAHELYTPTVVATDDVELHELGVVPLLAQIYRLCQEHAPDLEENFERVRRMSLTDQLASKKQLSKMKKNSDADQGAMKRKSPESATQSGTDLPFTSCARSASGSSQRQPSAVSNILPVHPGHPQPHRLSFRGNRPEDPDRVDLATHVRRGDSHILAPEYASYAGKQQWLMDQVCLLMRSFITF